MLFAAKLCSKGEVKKGSKFGILVPAIHQICGCLQQGPNTKRVVECNFHACCHGNQRWPEKGCHHGHCQEFLIRGKHACQLDTINSKEFCSCKKLATYSPVLLFLFRAKCGGRLPHEVLRHFMFIFPLSNHTE